MPRKITGTRQSSRPAQKIVAGLRRWIVDVGRRECETELLVISRGKLRSAMVITQASQSPCPTPRIRLADTATAPRRALLSCTSSGHGDSPMRGKKLRRQFLGSLSSLFYRLTLENHMFIFHWKNNNLQKLEEVLHDKSPRSGPAVAQASASVVARACSARPAVGKVTNRQAKLVAWTSELRPFCWLTSASSSSKSVPKLTR